MLTVVTGVEQPWYTEHLGEDCKVVICMPNMSSQVGEGAFAVSRNTNCTDEDVERVTAILRSCGLVEEIPDGMMAEILPFKWFGAWILLSYFQFNGKGSGKIWTGS